MSARHIMFFVGRPAGVERNVLQKVAHIARALDAEVEVFDCIFDPAITDCQKVQQAVDVRCGELDTVVRFLRELSVHSRVTVHWAYPPRQGVLLQVRAQPPDLLVVQSIDYRLIKRAPCPVWVIRNGRPYKEGCVMTALDVHRLGTGASRPEFSPGESSDLRVISDVSRSSFREARADSSDLLIVKAAPDSHPAPRIYLEGLRQATKAGSRGDAIMRPSQKWRTDT